MHHALHYTKSCNQFYRIGQLNLVSIRTLFWKYILLVTCRTSPFQPALPLTSHTTAQCTTCMLAAVLVPTPLRSAPQRMLQQSVPLPLASTAQEKQVCYLDPSLCMRFECCKGCPLSAAFSHCLRTYALCCNSQDSGNCNLSALATSAFRLLALLADIVHSYLLFMGAHQVTLINLSVACLWQ